MERTKNMQKMLDDITFAMLGHTNTEAKEKNFCVVCKSTKMNPEDFDDDLSRTEAKISQMCQDCQNKTFSCGPEGCSEE